MAETLLETHVISDKGRIIINLLEVFLLIRYSIIIRISILTLQFQNDRREALLIKNTFQDYVKEEGGRKAYNVPSNISIRFLIRKTN
jgi:hypothetical protein